MANVLYLIRHSVASRATRAESLAGLMWARPLRLLSSPLPMAMETAEALAGAWELPVELGADLAEMADGESLSGFYRRVESAWRRCQDLPEAAVACVTHGGIVSAWCCLFLGMELDDRCVFRAAHSTVTAFLRKRDGSGWELAFFNNKE